MAEPLRRHRLTPEEYLALERAAEEKSELIDGEMFAMSGGTFEHSILTASLARELGVALRGGACVVCSPDMRVKIEAAERYTYPDVSVVCGKPAFEDGSRDVLLNPVLIAEVLSQSSERYDRGEKFAAYRAIPSLTDYLLLSQTAPLVEHFRRQADGSWVLRTYGPGTRFPLKALGAELAVDEIYSGVFPPASAEPPAG